MLQFYKGCYKNIFRLLSRVNYSNSLPNDCWNMSIRTGIRIRDLAGFVVSPVERLSLLAKTLAVMVRKNVFCTEVLNLLAVDGGLTMAEVVKV